MLERVMKLYQSGSVVQAEKQARVALKKSPADYNLQHFLGVIYLREGRYSQAVKTLKAAIKLRDSDPNVYNNLGLAYHNLNKLKLALEAFDTAISLGVDDSVYRHRARVYRAAGRMDAAESDYQEAVRRIPGFSASIELASFLVSTAKYSEADRSLESLLQTPGLSDAELSRTYWQKIRLYEKTLQRERLYEAFERLIELDTAEEPFSTYLFQLNYNTGLSREELFASYRRYNERYSVPPDDRLPRRHETEPRERRKLKLAYISGDLSTGHSVSKFLVPLLEAHDRNAVSVGLYSTSTMDVGAYYDGARDFESPDEVELRRLQDEREKWHRRYRRLADFWTDVKDLGDRELAEKIRNDQVDVIIDCSGHTRGRRLAALSYAPAPVQVSWLGSGYTTGVEAINYFLGHENWTPASSDHLYSEQVFLLDRPPLTYMPDSQVPDVTALPALSNGFITFGCFSRVERINDAVVACWAALMNSVPESRLVLNTHYLEEPVHRDIVTQKFGQYGIPPGRLRLISTWKAETWEEYGKVDIALDPFPHNAGTTTFDALWQGVPVISLAGILSIERFGALILEELDLSDWIAGSTEEYVRIGETMSSDLASLEKLRRGLRSKVRDSVFLDYEGFARSLESAYREMFEISASEST